MQPSKYMGFVSFYVFAFISLYKALLVDSYFCKMSYILATIKFPCHIWIWLCLCFFFPPSSYDMINESLNFVSLFFVFVFRVVERS